MKDFLSFRHLSNADLVAAVSRFAHDERLGTAQLVASLAEFDRRRLYLDEGFKSLYAYCIEVLHLSEHAAYGRIEAARAARKFSCTLKMLEDGTLSLTNLCLLSRYLTEANHLAVLEEATHRRKHEVQRIVARLHPQPDVPSIVRKLPAAAVKETSPSNTTAEARNGGPAKGHLAPSVAADVVLDTPVAAVPVQAPAKPAVIAPLTPERYKIQITVDRETTDVLRQAQDLMRHSIPNGDPAAIIARALRVLVETLLKKKAAATEKPGRARGLADGSRTVPAAVKRAVWARDGGQCAFEGCRGRCPERGCLEYHHVIPYAMGGEATAANIELRCRAHNAHEARLAGLPLAPAGDETTGR